jgi:hypothetical protein
MKLPGSCVRFRPNKEEVGSNAARIRTGSALSWKHFVLAPASSGQLQFEEALKIPVWNATLLTVFIWSLVSLPVNLLYNTTKPRSSKDRWQICPAWTAPTCRRSWGINVRALWWFLSISLTSKLPEVTSSKREKRYADASSSTPSALFFLYQVQNRGTKFVTFFLFSTVSRCVYQHRKWTLPWLGSALPRRPSLLAPGLRLGRASRWLSASCSTLRCCWWLAASRARAQDSEMGGGDRHCQQLANSVPPVCLCELVSE